VLARVTFDVAMRPVVVVENVALTSAPAEVWPFLTDTDRTNRLVMGHSNTYVPIDPAAETSARFVVRSKTAGFTMEYEEAPFEWTLHKAFSVDRKMRSGPLLSYSFVLTLEPTADGGTHVTIRIELVPRHWTLTPVVHVQARRTVSTLAKIAVAVDAHVQKHAPSPFERPVSPASAERLAFADRELRKRQLPDRVVHAVVDLLQNAPDADVVRIRPYELAHEKTLDPRETLRGFLHAVTLGIVELRWALICPSCRTANDQVASLADIGTESHCQLCDLSYGIDLDRAVEATFVPHPSVRQVENQMFCIGGPWRTPHVVVQAVLDAHATKALEAPSTPGRYRLFARGGATASLEVRDDGPQDVNVTLDRELAPADLVIAPCGKLRVKNERSSPLHVKIERLGYASFAVTAHALTTMSEFRRFFSKDLLKPGTPLKVASCAILFSDLTGSTALYTAAGDAAAFRLVDDHFDVLRRVIDEHGGTVVKTMGDAIMASFLEPVRCVRAAIACLIAFEEFRGRAANGELTGLKLGLYSGPCYVVTANDTIDYFGQTVNCASRVQHCAASGEIVFEDDVYELLGDGERAQLRVVERFATKVKGVEHPLRLVRATLSDR
jgi:adenylate cyclase